MKRTGPLLSLFLALCVLLGPAAGCARNNVSTDTQSGQTLASDTVVLTVDEYPVYWPELEYWLKTVIGFYKDSYALDTITDWDAQQNGVPLRDFFLQTAVDYAGRHRALEKHAAAMGIELSQGQRDEMAATRAENVSIYGSESEYQRIVSDMYVSEDVYTYLLEIGYLSNDVFTALYGQNGEKCTDADVAAYVAQQSIGCARYIFASGAGTGMSEPSSAGELAGRALLEDCLRQLDASDDAVTLFETLAKKYDQDGASANYPDGMLFAAGAMGTEFQSAFAALAENEYSGIVETEKGLYLIMRLPVYPDMAANSTGTTLRYMAAQQYLFQNQVNAWYAGMHVEYSGAYKALDLPKLFD